MRIFRFLVTSFFSYLINIYDKRNTLMKWWYFTFLCWIVYCCLIILSKLCVSRMSLNRNLLITNLVKTASCPWPVPERWRGWPNIFTAARCLRLGPPSPSLSSRWNRRLPSSLCSCSSSFWGCWSCAASASCWIPTAACRVPRGRTIWKKTRLTTASPDGYLTRHLRADCTPQVLLCSGGGFVYSAVFKNCT